VGVLAPVPDGAVAQVRRTALHTEGRPTESSDERTSAFSELAMYGPGATQPHVVACSGSEYTGGAIPADLRRQ
jgi:hypothetical protein